MLDRSIACRAALPLLLASAGAPPATAQYPSGAIVQQLPQAGDPGERLAAALRTLAVSPNNIEALVTAGQTSLALGDASAAIGFFGRADQIAPRDGRTKAGLASALVQLQRPADALPLFARATALGVPDATIAADRGLAHDLLGDTAAAERDYRIALDARPDDDAARRRLALSEGIAGDRKAAIATLDPLIRKQDLAAWRAQTFVLAMTGDAGGANDITRVMMPTQQAALQPFLVRLAALTPAQKARAVHFGEMPTAGSAYPPTRVASAAPYVPPSATPTPAYPPVRPAPAPASDLAPVQTAVAAARAPAPVAVRAAPPAAVPIATPSNVAAATPVNVANAAPAVAKPTRAASNAMPPRVVSVANGNGGTVRYVRQRRDWRDVFAYNLPAYEYVPLASLAQSPPRSAPAAQPTPAPTIPAAIAALPTPVGASGAAASQAISTVASLRTPLPADHQTSVPATGPSDLAASAPVAPAAGLPLGASASSGHYDLPHASASPGSARARPSLASNVVRIAATKPRPAAHSGAAGLKSGVGTSDDEAGVSSVSRSKSGDTRSVSAPSDRVVGEKTPRTSKTITKVDRVDDSDAPASGRKATGRTAKTAEAETDETPRGKAGRDHADAGDAAKSKHDRDAKPGEAKADGGDEDTGTGKGHHDRASTKKTEPEKPASRVYVQVAGGANRDDLDKAWTGVRKKAPELMKGKAPSTTPLKATNRLLVGPFKDEDEAQAFVNKMAGKGVSGFVFKSAKGQKVEKIDTGG